MLNNFTSTIGIDISDHVIRLIFAKKKRGKFIIKSFAGCSLPIGLISNGLVKDESKITEILKKLFKDSHLPLRTIPVVASLPESHAFIKTITLEAGIDIKNEMPKHIPFPFKDVIIDILNHQSVMVNEKIFSVKSFAAIKKDVAESYARILEASGTHIRALEIESQALARLFISPIKSKTVQILVDIGRNHTTFALLNNDHIDFTHTSTLFCGNKLSENISLALKCSPEEAEIQKIASARNPSLRQIIEKYAVELSVELDKVIKFHREHILTDLTRDYLIELTGGGSQLPYLAQYLEEKVRCPVHEVKIPDNMFLPDKLKPVFSSFATAIGLARREFQ